MAADHPPSDYAAIVRRIHPELGGADIAVITQGWHSVAVDVDDRWIFRFPQNDAARAALRRERVLLKIIRAAVRLPVPDLALHEGPPLFSRHAKLKGTYLLPGVYERLGDAARERLGAALAGFYRDLHALDRSRMAAHGAAPIEAWLPVAEIERRALPLLPPERRDWARRTLEAYAALPVDPHGITFGFFDGHGWNMAFDAAAATLNGIYDFGDSGLGPLHQEFIYSNFISPDLTRRIVAAYEAESRRRLDRQRIDLLTGVHRLSELAAWGDDPAHAPMLIRHAVAWAAHDDAAGSRR